MHYNNKKVRFCGGCGFDTAPPPTKPLCCGRVVNGKFCSQCGSSLSKILGGEGGSANTVSNKRRLSENDYYERDFNAAVQASIAEAEGDEIVLD